MVDLLKHYNFPLGKKYHNAPLNGFKIKIDYKNNLKNRSVINIIEPKIMNNIKKLKLIRLGKGIKVPPYGCSWLEVKDWIDWDYYVNNTKGENYGVLCGNYTIKKGVKQFHNNNIIIVDIDFHKGITNEELEQHPFIKDFGLDYIKKFNTFTSKTTSKGFHLYFKYNPLFWKIGHSGELKMDLISNRGYVVGCGSKAKSKGIMGCYSCVNNTTIKEMPQILVDWILKNFYGGEKPKAKKPKKNPIKKTFVDCAFKYCFTKAELTEIIRSLDGKEYENEGIKYTFRLGNYMDWYKFTTLMKCLGKQRTWDKVSQKYPNYDLDNNLIIWNSIGGHQYLPIVEFFLYKIIKSEILINYIKYKPKLPKINKDRPRKIIKGVKVNGKTKLGDIFREGINYVIKADTGTGKTTSGKIYLDRIYTHFCSIVSRTSLGQEQTEVFAEYGLTPKFYKLNKSNFVSYINGDNPVIQIDSLGLMGRLEIKDYVIFLDEFNSIIEYLWTSDTLNTKRVQVFQAFKKVIQNAKQVICVDADISEICFDFLDYCGIKYEFMELKYKHNAGIKAIEISDEDEFMMKLAVEDKFICATDSLLEAKRIALILKNMGVEGIQLITSETELYKRLDFYDKIIFSPKIIYGLDSVMRRSVWCWYKEHTITTENFLQQISRARNITKLTYHFMRKRVNKPTWDSLEDCYKDLLIQENESITQFKMFATNEDNNIYVKILSKILYNIDCDKTNRLCHFKLGLQKKGFIDNNLYATNKTYDKTKQIELLNTLKKQKLENFNPDSDSIKRLNEYLEIPKDKLESYKEFLTDSNQIRKHFIISNFHFKEQKDVVRKIENLDEFNVKVSVSSKYKIFYFNKLLEVCKAEGLNPTRVLTAEESELYMGKYNIIFRNRGKNDEELTTMKILTKYIGKISKNLFGDLYDSKLIKVGKGKDRTWYSKFTLDNEKYGLHEGIAKYRGKKLITYHFRDDYVKDGRLRKMLNDEIIEVASNWSKRYVIDCDSDSDSDEEEWDI